MDEMTQTNWEHLRSHDGNLRFAALNSMLAATCPGIADGDFDGSNS